MVIFEDALLDIAWKNLESENNRFKDIDTKAIGIITITGILMTFLTKPTSSGVISTILFTLTSLSFLGAIFLSIMVIRVRHAETLSTKYLIEDFKDEKSERQIKGLIGTIAETEKNLRSVCNNKAEELTYAVYVLGVSIVLLIFYSISVAV
jgi:hypothetical protein